MGSSSSPLQQAHIVLRPSGANMLQIPKLDRGGTMVSRRKFLGFTGLAAAWPNAAWTQDEKGKAKPKPKPEGVVVNDVHAQLNSTRVYRIVEPQSIDAVRAAMTLASCVPAAAPTTPSCSASRSAATACSASSTPSRCAWSRAASCSG